MSMTRYIREVIPCPATAESWGYPRKLSDVEVDQACWLGMFAPELEALAWFLPIPETDWIQAHVCGRPGRGFMLGDAHSERVLESYAELMGGTRIYSVIPKDVGALDERLKSVMRRYLRIRHWREDGLGMYKDLGG